MSTDLKAGDTIPAGSFVLITSGSYSDFGVNGLYRADSDVVVPGKAQPYQWRGSDIIVDEAALSLLLTEVNYMEAWCG